jgi:tRNA pseudouridine38-40 synthase
VPETLDVTAMNRACQPLLGSHDFASFGKPPQGEITIREMMHAGWVAQDNRLVLTITANAFLYRMVRTIVGTLIRVGQHRLAVDDIKQILDAHDLTRSASPAPAHGLCLIRVAYAEDTQKQD